MAEDQKKPQSALTVFFSEAKRMTPQFARVLPAHLPAERLVRTIESAIMATPKLLDCDRGSLWKAFMSAAVFGLEVDGHQSAVLPYKSKAQFIPMVAGLITLADNAGRIVDAAVVRKADAFDYQRGTSPLIHHVPKRDQGRGTDNPIVAAYCIAWPKGSRHDFIFDVLELPDIIARRDRSASFKFKPSESPWSTDFPAMARKSAIRALANQLPWQVQKAVELEARAEDGEVVYATKAADGGVVIDGDSERVNEMMASADE